MTKQLSIKLQCDLTEADLLERGQRLADAEREAAELHKDKADAAKEFKERLEDVYGRIRETAEAIRCKSEFRLVPCQIAFASLSGTKRTIRLDTGEVVREEPMTSEERQANLYPAAPEESTQV